MQNFYKFVLVLFLLGGFLYGQRAHIEIYPMSPDNLKKSGLTTNGVSNGLKVFGKETYIYLTPKNIGNNEPITSADFSFVNKPAGSNAVFSTFSTNSVYFKSDVNGEYQVKLSITTASGTHDTTVSFYSANYVGVGNFEGIAAQYPNCMSCHGSTPSFISIFNAWKETGHALKFRNGLNANPIYYNASCFKCHTTGYDHNNQASNDGFDDVASSLGWIFYPPVAVGKWDTLKANFPRLTQLANIGCESCHGPGGEHALGGSKNKIHISYKSGSCMQCHGEIGYYNKVAQWENSIHTSPVWSGSFAQGSSSQNNNLQNCIRCHDGQGFTNFTKGKTTNTAGWNVGKHTNIGCPTCHEPHGGGLRPTPAGSDTLGNGLQYTGGGKGRLCMNCHKTRRSADTYASTQVNNANWGPHYSVQTDIYLGKNVAEFGSAYPSTPHNIIMQDACVDCHLSASPDSTSPNYNKMGDHTFKLNNPETNSYLTTKCQPCHYNKTKWEDFIAKADYDGNGTVEYIQKEFDGLMKKLKYYLPPAGVDSVAWQAIRDLNDPVINKAYYNYRIFYADGSKGMHNTLYTINALRASILAIGGVISSTQEGLEIPFEFALAQNYPNPFNPTTKIDFVLPEASKVKLTVYDITGKEVAVLVNENKNQGKYSVDFDGSKLPSGVYLYNIQTDKHSATKKLVLMK